MRLDILFGFFALSVACTPPETDSSANEVASTSNGAESEYPESSSSTPTTSASTGSGESSTTNASSTSSSSSTSNGSTTGTSIGNAAITGTLGSLALDILGAGSLEVAVYSLDANGLRGQLLSSVPVEQTGAFTLQLPEGNSNLELAARTVQMGLVSGNQPEFRTRFNADQAGGTVGINAVTEMMTSRMQKLISDGNSLSDAMISAQSEIKVTTGVEDSLGATYTLNSYGLQDNSARLSVFDAGLQLHAESKTATKSDYFAKLKADFIDGTLDGRIGSNYTATIGDGDELLFSPHGFESDLTSAMKLAIKSESDASVTLNLIPAISGHHSSTISYLSPEQKLAYQPSIPDSKLYFVDFKKHNGASEVYSGLHQCLGAFSIQRIDDKAQPLSIGDEFQISLGDTSNSSPGTYHMQSDCSDNAINSINVPQNSLESAQFYYKVNNLLHKSMKAEITNKPFGDVAIAYLGLFGTYNGKPIGTQIGLSLIDDYTKYPNAHSYVGDFSSPLARETCHALVAEFMNPYLGSVYPQNVTLNPLFNQDAASNDIAFYSDVNCTTAITQITIPAGQTHVLRYLKIPGNYTPNIGSIGSRFILGTVITPSSITEMSRLWSYAVTAP
jgi:hypothetical protein